MLWCRIFDEIVIDNRVYPFDGKQLSGFFKNHEAPATSVPSLDDILGMISDGVGDGALWRLHDDELWLVEFRPSRLGSERRRRPFEQRFPGVTLPLRADWYNGYSRFPRGG